MSVCNRYRLRDADSVKCTTFVSRPASRDARASTDRAEPMLLQIPDLVAQINTLNAEVAALKKASEAAKPKAKKPAAP